MFALSDTKHVLHYHNNGLINQFAHSFVREYSADVGKSLLEKKKKKKKKKKSIFPQLVVSLDSSRYIVG